MSGGHFDYGCFRISQFADELRHEIETNDNKLKDEYGDRISAGFKPETLLRVKAAHRVIEQAGRLAKEAEWLYSGDHGEDTFNELIDRILEE